MTTMSMNEVTINLANVVEVVITNNDLECTATCYSLREGVWIKLHGVSSVEGFVYNESICPVCGQFADHVERPEDCSPYWSGYICGDFTFIDEEELISRILQAKSDGLDVEYTKEWQNTGMDNQPIFRWGTFRFDDCLGDHKEYTVFSYDQSRKYSVKSYGVQVKMLYDFPVEEDFVYYPEDCSMEEDGYDTEVLIHSFLMHTEEVWTRGYTDIYFDDVAENMMAMSERYYLGWVAQKGYNHEEYSDFVRIYSREFAEKAHIGEDTVFCYTEEALVRTMAECENAWTDFKKHEVISFTPDGHEEEEAYVVYLNKPQRMNYAQKKLIQNTITKLDKAMAQIDELWANHCIDDVTEQPEFEKYEKMLMLRAELSEGVE